MCVWSSGVVLLTEHLQKESCDTIKLMKRGFTLVELLVVIAIIGILASIVTVSLSSAQARARDTKTVQELSQLRNAINNARITTGSYPSGGHWTSSGSTCSGMVPTPVGTFETIMTNAGATVPADSQFASDPTYCYTLSVGSGWQCGGLTISTTYQYAITFKAEGSPNLPALNAGTNRYCIVGPRI